MTSLKFLASITLLSAPFLIAAEPIRLEPEPDSMVVHCTVPMLGNEKFSAVLPKVLGDRDRVYLNEPLGCAAKWEGPGAQGEWSAVSPDGLSVAYRITLTPSEDHVAIEYEVTNRSGAAMEDVWMMTYFAPREAAWLGPNPLDQITMETGAGPLTLSATDRPTGARPELAIYRRKGAPPLPFFIKELHPASDTKSTGDWMQARRNDGATVTVTAKPAAFLFNNASLSSLHVAPSFGTIKPGKTAAVKGEWRFSASPPKSP